ncbi:MAG: phosphoribosylamine--glycine ligase, partial [Acidimicrobiales bacterium]
DFKRVGDGDEGPNTGGMGAYSPVPIAGDDVMAMVMERAVDPTLAALRRQGIDYRGVLYAGLMLTPDGPKVIEYNVRFGDPEAQVVLPRVSSDLTQLLARAASGALDDEAPTFVDDAAVTVVCATEGYPRSPRLGDPIEGLDLAARVEGVSVFCAGVSRPEGAADDGPLLTAGGRVLALTGMGPDLATARSRAYQAVACVSWPGMHVRSDIAAAAAHDQAHQRAHP